MDKKQEIIFKYYEHGLVQTEIAKQLNISKAYVTKIIKKDNRYEKEKQKRKDKNKIKNKEETKKYIKIKRSYEKILNEYLKKQHIETSIELSSRHSISNKSFRDWNKSIYEYNSKSKTYNLKKGIKVSKMYHKK